MLQAQNFYLIMLFFLLGCFLVCWIPFFTCNIINAICIKYQFGWEPGETAFLVTTFIGYINSCLNPVIYTIFNPEFRKAFKKILGLGHWILLACIVYVHGAILQWSVPSQLKARVLSKRVTNWINKQNINKFNHNTTLLLFRAVINNKTFNINTYF